MIYLCSTLCCLVHLKPNHAAVGYYKLESDAALAYDEALKLLKGDDCSKINFSSTQEYVNARAKEVEQTDSSYQTLTEIARKIQKHLSKIPCPEIDAINDAMAKKWERYLPSETGKDFLASYQKSIDEVLGFVEPEQSEVTTSTSTVPPTVSPNALFKPIADGNSDDSSSESIEQKKATNNMSHSLDRSKVDAIECTAPITTKKRETAQMKDFPIGCPVLWDFKSKSFCTGVVTGVGPAHERQWR